MPHIPLAFVERSPSHTERKLAATPGPLPSSPATRSPTASVVSRHTPVDVIVAGSLAFDLSCDYAPLDAALANNIPHLHTSNPSVITQGLGGVGQNVATAIHLLGTSVRLCSAVATDLAGSAAIEALAERGMDTSGIIKQGSGARTAQYVAINGSKKDLVVAMADMKIMEDQETNFEAFWKSDFEVSRAKWLVVDANWDPATLKRWVSAGKASGAKVAFEPVSTAKSKRLFLTKTPGRIGVVPDHNVDLVTPNAFELSAMYNAAEEAELFDRQDWWRVIDSLGMSSMGSRDKLVAITNTALVDRGFPQQSIKLLAFIPCILTKLAEQGVLMTQLLRPGDPRLTSPESAPYVLSRSHSASEFIGGVYMRLFPPAEKLSDGQIVSVNGVGDTFLGVVVAGLAKEEPKSVMSLIDIAQKGSVMTLKSKDAISPEIYSLKSSL